ncbi:MAG: type I-C CRISPR-associated protein Cas8c/Csd1 [bacterium]
MIIQALNEYYGRLKEDVNSDIPLFGFSREKIHFALVLDKSGKFLDVKDLREKKDKKTIAKELVVPQGTKKSVNIEPNFMWGNTDYVLGASNKEYKEKNRPKEMFKAFKEFQTGLSNEIDDIGMKAMLNFLDSWKPENAEKLNDWKEMAGMNVVFQLDGEREYIHDHLDIKNKWMKYCEGKQSEYIAFCLVSGVKRPIERLHFNIKGVYDPTNTKGANIVSFNQDSFSSYNKIKGFNAPVSKTVAFNYTTALNHLLRFDSRQKVQISDSTTVFWAEGETPIEGFLKDILDPKDNQADLTDLRRFLEAVREGKKPKEIENAQNMKFYILGLSPNASRLSVRFWYVSTVEDISYKIVQHFKDLEIIKSYETDPEYPGMWHLLHETAVQEKTKNISPLLAGALMRSIITGASYPSTLLTVVLNRIKADQKINYLRVALIKAYLVRNWRLKNKKEKEVNMALNREEKDIGYRLGRLFSILEKAQKDAIPGANTTIKDRFYGSASATPSVVFPQLLRLAQHHIQKSDFGANIEKHIEEIMADIPKFPSHLSLEEQGMFAIGYYQQKPELYKKTEKKEG